MRYFVVMTLAALPITFFAVGPSSAEQLNGAEFKKLVIGNTLQTNFYSNKRGRQYDFRYYFKNETTIHFSSDNSSNEQDEELTITQKGKWCRTSGITFRTYCFKKCKHKDNKISCKTGRRGRANRVFIILKGKHEY